MSRPSLLSAAQQAEADRNKILTNLEGGAAAMGKPSAMSGQRKALVAGIALLALMAAGGAWFFNGVGKDAMPAIDQAVLAPARAVAPTQTVASAATIHDEQALALAAAPQRRPTLDDMLNASTEPAAGTTANVLSNALEAPSKAKAATPKAGNTASKKTASKEKPLRKPVQPRRAQASDSDVALLAALLVHTQANMPTRASALAQLKQCGKMSAAEAEQCRVRVCDARQVPGCDASATAPSTP